MLELLRLVPRPLNVKFVCSKEGDGEVMFIEIIQDDDEPRKEGPNKGEGETNKGPEIMKRKLDPRENLNRGGSNFTGRIKGMHVFVGNFTYVVDFMIVEEISSIIDPRADRLSALEVVVGYFPLAYVDSLGPAAVVRGVTVVSELLLVFQTLALGLGGVAPVATA
nr:MAK10-like protein [Tanacetum cinerariifolium]